LNILLLAVVERVGQLPRQAAVEQVDLEQT
jgi:hypothetical protein